MFLHWLYRQYLPKDMCSAQDCSSLEVADVVVSWNFSDIAFDVSINYPSCTYDDWYDLYFLMDFVVTRYGHIYDDTLVAFLLLNYQVWFIV